MQEAPSRRGKCPGQEASEKTASARVLAFVPFGPHPSCGGTAQCFRSQSLQVEEGRQDAGSMLHAPNQVGATRDCRVERRRLSRFDQRHIAIPEATGNRLARIWKRGPRDSHVSMAHW